MPKIINAQNLVIFLLVAIFSSVFVILYFNFLAAPTPFSSQEPLTLHPVIEAGKLDFTVFDHIFFNKARQAVVPEIVIQEKGRMNPFLPF